ncbi:MAG: CdaR family protein [Tissierellia bacterium]|nr:CdaR family protein [Tissierellia bacterium]
MKIKNEKLFIQITCLIISIGLWAIVMVQTNPIQDANITNIPVTIKSLSALDNSNMVLMNVDKDNLTINVKVKGTAEQLVKINKSDFSAYIDVLGFTEGTQNAKVEITGPSGIEIISTYPSQIPCTVESIVSRVMDVDIKYDGNQAKDYYRGYGEPNPSSVKITGPRSIVDSAKYAIATINVEGATSLVEKIVPVRIYNGVDTEIFMSSPVDNVKVTVPIYPTKYVNLIPNIIGEPLEGYKLVDVTVNPQRVRIAGRKDILDTIKELEVQELDITGSYHNVLSSKEIIDDNDIIILGLDSSPVVSATIEEIIEKEIVVDLDEIEITNINEGYAMNILDEDQTISITVVGASSIVNKITKNDIKLSIDLGDAVLGTNNITIQKNTDKVLDNILLNKDTIKVELIKTSDALE